MDIRKVAIVSMAWVATFATLFVLYWKHIL